MPHRVAPQAETDLGGIWLAVAKQSRNPEIANRLIDSITERFLVLARHPYLGRPRDEELGAGLRSFPVGEYVVVYCVENQDVLILRVVHGRRDLEGLLF